MKNEYMNLSFYQMWYFICAMELGSYSKASQKINVTQSAISKTIQNIEQNLQVQLFAREKNILVPTEAGKSLYRSWKDVISAMQILFDILDCLTDGRLCHKIGRAHV